MDQLSSEADKQRALLKVKQAEAEEALGFIQASMMQVGIVFPLLLNTAVCRRGFGCLFCCIHALLGRSLGPFVWIVNMDRNAVACGS